MTWFTSNEYLTYMIVFSTFASVLWLYYYVGLYLFTKEKKYVKYEGVAVAIIPCYNENAQNLKDTIDAISSCSDIKDFVFVNDGSTKPEVLQTLQDNLDKSHYITYDKNKGKRGAQKTGVEHFVNKYGEGVIDTIVMLDSDTTFEHDAIFKLLSQMNDPTIGGVTANIKVKNRETNILTRALSAMYWSSSNIWRAAPDAYGYQQVTNGQLSCYRAKPLIELMDDYVTQVWWGRKCAFSDDRWVTQQIQFRYKLKITFAQDAIAYTFVPETYSQAWKMLSRWKKGAIRETLIQSKNIKKNPAIVIDSWWNLLVSLLQITIRVSILIIAFNYPMILLWYILMMSIISVMYGFDMIFNNPKELPWRVVYTWMNELFFGWITIYAIFTIRNQGWATR